MPTQYRNRSVPIKRIVRFQEFARSTTQTGSTVCDLADISRQPSERPFLTLCGRAGSPAKALLSDRRRVRELRRRRGGKSNSILSDTGPRELHLSCSAQTIHFKEDLVPREARTGNYQLFKKTTGRFGHGLNNLIARR